MQDSADRASSKILSRSALRIVVVSVLAVGAGFLCRWLVNVLFGLRIPYLVFLPCIVAAGLAGGRIAGVLTLAAFALLSAVALEPTTLVHTPNPAAGLLVFALGGIVLIAITEWANQLRGRVRTATAVLRESENRLRAAVEAGGLGTRHFRVLTETVPDFVWSCNADGRVEYLNPQYVRFTGITLERVNEGGWHEIVHPDDVAPVEKVWAQSLAQGQPFELEYRFRRQSDGQYRWFLSRTVPVRDDHGRILRWVGAATDVHDSKVSREERDRLLSAERSAREELERAGRIKDQFLAVLSHELRTPLTPVLMTVSLLETNAELPESMREDIASIRRSVELEARLIDDLLDLTRLSRGKIRYDFQTVDLHLLIRSAVSICCNDGKHQVDTDLGAESSFVRGDPTRLQQVFWNLLNNAWKFTPPNGKVTISTRSSGGRVTISVTDNGSGIEPELLPRIFDAFEQGDVIRARRFGGLGLGLAICKALVHSHGGTISAASAGTGQGSQFLVDLPSVPSPHPGNAPAPAFSRTMDDRRGLRMLLIEDHPSTLRALTKLLSAIGHDVEGASTVADGLRAAAGGRYDLVISDLGLPDGTGFELMRQLQDLYGLRGIALSGYGMEEDIERSREAGFAEHVVKPVDLQKLREAIARVACGELGAGTRG